jgi:PPOX class probable F420-dependent enzyme
MSELTSFASLDRNPFIALTTYRKNGTPVMTPVWFVKQDGKLFVWTAVDSGKAKRLKNNSCVQLGPSNHSGKLLGAIQAGRARFAAKEEYPALDKAFKAKYGGRFVFLHSSGKSRNTSILILRLHNPILEKEINNAPNFDRSILVAPRPGNRHFDRTLFFAFCDLPPRSGEE